MPAVAYVIMMLMHSSFVALFVVSVWLILYIPIVGFVLFNSFFFPPEPFDMEATPRYGSIRRD